MCNTEVLGQYFRKNCHLRKGSEDFNKTLDLTKSLCHTRVCVIVITKCKKFTVYGILKELARKNYNYIQQRLWQPSHFYIWSSRRLRPGRRVKGQIKIIK